VYNYTSEKILRDKENQLKKYKIYEMRVRRLIIDQYK
jgi:hypothetical protein